LRGCRQSGELSRLRKRNDGSGTCEKEGRIAGRERKKEEVPRGQKQRKN
jgi:hypothetical protein